MPKDTTKTRTGTATGKPPAPVASAQNGSGPQSSTSSGQPTRASSGEPAAASDHADSAAMPLSSEAARSVQPVSLGYSGGEEATTKRIRKPRAKKPPRPKNPQYPNEHAKNNHGGARVGAGRKRKELTDLHAELFQNEENLRKVHAVALAKALDGDSEMIKYYQDRAYGKPTITTATAVKPMHPLILEGLEPDEEVAK